LPRNPGAERLPGFFVFPIVCTACTASVPPPPRQRHGDRHLGPAPTILCARVPFSLTSPHRCTSLEIRPVCSPAGMAIAAVSEATVPRATPPGAPHGPHLAASHALPPFRAIPSTAPDRHHTGAGGLPRA